MNKWIVVLVALAVLGGGYKVYSSRKPVLNLAFKAEKAEKAVTLDDMRGGKPHLVISFLFAGCPASKMVAEMLKAEHGKDPKYSIAGITVGSAEQVVSSFELPFPVYNARDATDPYAMNELIKRVGSLNRVNGGTTIVLDSRLRIVEELKDEEVRELVPVLAKL